MGDKFFDTTQELVAASMQAVRVLCKQKDLESRMIHDNLVLALKRMGVNQALKSLKEVEHHA